MKRGFILYNDIVRNIRRGGARSPALFCRAQPLGCAANIAITVCRKPPNPTTSHHPLLRVDVYRLIGLRGCLLISAAATAGIFVLTT